jgi:hypothetical protein
MKCSKTSDADDGGPLKLDKEMQFDFTQQPSEVATCKIDILAVQGIT